MLKILVYWQPSFPKIYGFINFDQGKHETSKFPPDINYYESSLSSALKLFPMFFIHIYRQFLYHVKEVLVGLLSEVTAVHGNYLK